MVITKTGSIFLIYGGFVGLFFALISTVYYWSNNARRALKAGSIGCAAFAINFSCVINMINWSFPYYIVYTEWSLVGFTILPCICATHLWLRYIVKNGLSGTEIDASKFVDQRHRCGYCGNHISSQVAYCSFCGYKDNKISTLA